MSRWAVGTRWPAPARRALPGTAGPAGPAAAVTHLDARGPARRPRGPRPAHVDAVTTDGTILLGYVAQHPDELQVVGDTFTEERYGIGYPKGDTAFCTLIDAALTAAYKDGTWARAFRSTLGSAGTRAPSPPSLDPCL